MYCFYCVVEQVRNQEYDDPKDSVTEYKGTPVCASHAKDCAEEELRWNEEYSVTAIRKAAKERQIEALRIAKLLKDYERTLVAKQ